MAATGPADGTTQADYLYRNLLADSGSASFERITDPPIGTDLQDGQMWNWIDDDNDGDLDAYLTNWGQPLGGLANRLYRNDGGSFTGETSGAIVTDIAASLGSIWVSARSCLVILTKSPHQSSPGRCSAQPGCGTSISCGAVAMAATWPA